LKSYWIRATDTATVLEERDVPIPEPGEGQVLVRLHAAGLNRGEFMSRTDLHGAAGPARPAGTEGAGEVVSVGPGVSAFKPGDRVMASCRGTFAEYAVMPTAVTMGVPENLTWEEAACTPLVFLVVHDMLIAQGRILPGEWVFVAGASSGVGVATILAAKAVGAKTIGTSGSTEKLARLHTLGLDVGIHTRGPHFHGAIMEATGGDGADIIVNSVGGTVFEECIRSLAYCGRLAMIGYVDRVLTSTIDLAALHGKRLSIFGVSAVDRTPAMRAAAVRGFVQDFIPLLASGKMKPVIDRVFPLAELSTAKAFMESDAHVGKIAVTILDKPEAM
jgi:NADPH:quinone reductase-like Zn-dependent oxidoreductase